MAEITEDNIVLFASVFRGRQDIYAVRWEKDGKSGYIPACKVDWSSYVYPFAFEGKLIQYIGRIQRSVNPPVIFDYRDARIDFFEKMFKQRNRYYKKLLK